MKVGVYGLGRFGAFWASELAKHMPVKGYNRSKIEQAPSGVQMVSEEELLLCDTIILCVAISSFREVIARISPKIRSHTLVMDTCSVKVYPAKVMQELLPKETEIIATHPMFGPDSGNDGIARLPLVFSPIRCSKTLEEYWRHEFKGMQLRVLEMSCDQHDKEAAYSQGVTHFIGRVLDELQLQPTQLATVGYRQLMSIVEQTCNDPIQLFYDLQRYNPYTHDMHGNLNKALETMLHVLDTYEKNPVEF